MIHRPQNSVDCNIVATLIINLDNFVSILSTTNYLFEKYSFYNCFYVNDVNLILLSSRDDYFRNLCLNSADHDSHLQIHFAQNYYVANFCQ